MASSGPGSNTIKVVARFRPQNKVELASGGEPIVEFENEQSCKINVSLLSRLRKGNVW
jgi:kinesin family protein 5